MYSYIYTFILQWLRYLLSSLNSICVRCNGICIWVPHNGICKVASPPLDPIRPMSICLCLRNDLTSSVNLFVLGAAIQGNPSICHPDFWFYLWPFQISSSGNRFHTFDLHEKNSRHSKSRFNMLPPIYFSRPNLFCDSLSLEKAAFLFIIHASLSPNFAIQFIYIVPGNLLAFRMNAGQTLSLYDLLDIFDKKPEDEK